MNAMDNEFDTLKLFLDEQAEMLPGSTPDSGSAERQQYVEPSGLVWTQRESLEPSGASTKVKNGSPLWCTLEGSWPPYKIYQGSEMDFLALLELSGLLSGAANCDGEMTDIQLWRPRWHKKGGGHPGKGNTPKPAVLIRLYWF